VALRTDDGGRDRIRRTGLEEVTLTQTNQHESAHPIEGAGPRSPTAAPPPDIVAEEALIREARQRQRRRRRWIAGIVVAALAGVGVGLWLSRSAPAPVPRRVSASTTPSVSPPRTSASPVLNRPEALASTANGDLLIANQGTNQILRRLPDGTLQVVAGSGSAGYGGDGGPAVRAELDTPNGIAVAPDGTIYVADTANNRVRAISPSGKISTVAGNGKGLSPGAGSTQTAVGPFGVPAIDAKISDPLSVAVGRQDQLYVADSAGIQVVGRNGELTNLSVTGLHNLGIGTPAGLTAAAVTVDHAGDLYVGDFSPKLLIELSPSGSVLHSWGVYVAPGGLATAPDGSILVADYGFTLDRISNGALTHIATFALNSVPGVTGTLRPSGVGETPTGTTYFDTDGANGGTNTPALGAIGGQGRVQLLTTGTNTPPKEP
jgi:NHL repeat